MKKESPVLFVNKENCCGCSACAAICPQKCITMVADGFGFLYPSISKDKCVGCLRCIKVCPLGKEANI